MARVKVVVRTYLTCACGWTITVRVGVDQEETEAKRVEARAVATDHVSMIHHWVGLPNVTEKERVFIRLVGIPR